jgi:hypothetical protein
LFRFPRACDVHRGTHIQPYVLESAALLAENEVVSQTQIQVLDIGSGSRQPDGDQFLRMGIR